MEPSATTAPTTELRPEVLTSPGSDRECDELWRATFPVPSGASFYDDFPIWSEARASASGIQIRRVGFRADGKLVAISGARIAEYATSDGPLKAALIGGVACLGDYRKQGLASRLVEACSGWAAEEGIHLLALWGSEHSMYQRLGFELCGTQLRINVSDLLATNTDRENRRGQIRSGWNSKILQLLSKRPYGLKLATEHLPWISAHKNIEWRWLETANGPEAYIAYNRGIDLDGIVHEWGGFRAGIRTLLKEATRERPELQLISPPGLLEKVGFALPQNSAQEYVCMARALTSHGRDLLAHSPLWFWGLDGA